MVAKNYIDEVHRKLIHLSSLWMVVALYLLTYKQSLFLFTLLLMVMVAFEMARRYWPFFKNLTHRLIGSILRPHESAKNAEKMTGAFYVVLAVFLSILLFPKIITITAISIMLLADTAAALIGKKFGKYKLLNKSIEGSTAFFITSVAVLLTTIAAGLPIAWYAVPLVAFLATLIELISDKIKIDDNLSIAMGTGAALMLCQYI